MLQPERGGALIAMDLNRGEGFASAQWGSVLQVEPGPQRKIIHVDMDAFYESVEQRDNPSPVGGEGSPLWPRPGASEVRLPYRTADVSPLPGRIPGKCHERTSTAMQQKWRLGNSALRRRMDWGGIASKIRFGTRNLRAATNDRCGRGTVDASAS